MKTPLEQFDDACREIFPEPPAHGPQLPIKQAPVDGFRIGASLADVLPSSSSGVVPSRGDSGRDFEFWRDAADRAEILKGQRPRLWRARVLAFLDEHEIELWAAFISGLSLAAIWWWGRSIQ